jgi:hypothetical protein
VRCEQDNNRIDASRWGGEERSVVDDAQQNQPRYAYTIDPFPDELADTIEINVLSIVAARLGNSAYRSCTLPKLRCEATRLSYCME